MDLQARKATLRMLSNGVYIVTSRSGECYGGATITWVSQASFQPPLVMAAIRTQSSVFRCMQESRKAALHILAAEQRELAQRFFTPTTVESGHMNGEAFQLSRRELPILASAPAYLECGVREIFDRTGDHAIVVLEVLEAVCQRRARPMTIAESPWQYGG